MIDGAAAICGGPRMDAVDGLLCNADSASFVDCRRRQLARSVRCSALFQGMVIDESKIRYRADIERIVKGTLKCK